MVVAVYHAGQLSPRVDVHVCLYLFASLIGILKLVIYSFVLHNHKDVIGSIFGKMNLNSLMNIYWWWRIDKIYNELLHHTNLLKRLSVLRYTWWLARKKGVWLYLSPFLNHGCQGSIKKVWGLVFCFSKTPPKILSITSNKSVLQPVILETGMSIYIYLWHPGVVLCVWSPWGHLPYAWLTPFRSILDQ